MYNKSYSSDSQLNKAMSNEQFNQVVDAILSGKYSWACLLILRFSGYNPLHYIPYRTYNRLMKTNCETTEQLNTNLKVGNFQEAKNKQQSVHKLRDLDFYSIEEVEDQSTKVKGGEKSFSMGLLYRMFGS
jgi:hypothetical protein